jgi:hypothetical protein
MPESCFSYSSDMPLGTGTRDDLPRAPRGGGDMGACFSYPAGAPLGNLRRMPSGPCFSYPADMPPPRLRRMPRDNPSPCFSYSEALTAPPSFTTTACFRY